MMIDLKKKYRTRAGAAVTLLGNNGRPPYPIYGYVGGSNYLSCWRIDGVGYGVGSQLAGDLIEVVEEKWVNLYQNMSSTGPSRVHSGTKTFSSKEDAEREGSVNFGYLTTVKLKD